MCLKGTIHVTVTRLLSQLPAKQRGGRGGRSELGGASPGKEQESPAMGQSWPSLEYGSWEDMPVPTRPAPGPHLSHSSWVSLA